MNKYKLTDQNRAYLRGYVNQLGDILLSEGNVAMYDANELIDITGQDLLLSGQTEVEGKKIDPKLTYRLRIHRAQEVSHMRRVCRAYKKNGFEGVNAYFKSHDFSLQLK